jgi:hypothetical protein
MAGFDTMPGQRIGKVHVSIGVLIATLFAKIRRS